MSEARPTYYAGDSPPATREAFRNRRCALPFCDPEYEPPTPIEVDALIKYAGWSQTDAAKLVGVTYNPKKGSTTIRKWRTMAPSKESREIPYSAWRHLLVCAGIVSIDEDLEAIRKE